MQKPVLAIAFLSIIAASSAFAQRGGLAGHGGGFGSRATPAFHSGPAITGFSGFASPAHISGFAASIHSSQRPPIASPSPFRSSSGPLRGNPYRRQYRSYPIAYPYALTGWLDPGYLDPNSYDSSSIAPQPPATYADDASAEPPLPQQSTDQQLPAPIFRPAYTRPQLEPTLPPESAVTLIFKDGRPAEQIHNYMLTRTTLYVQEQHLRKIPVDQLDLDATAKANLDAGIDFRLPTAR